MIHNMCPAPKPPGSGLLDYFRITHMGAIYSIARPDIVTDGEQRSSLCSLRPLYVAHNSI